MDQMTKINKIIDDHMSALQYLATGKTTPPSRITQKVGLSSTLNNLIDTSYQYGKSIISMGKNLVGKTVNKVLSAIRSNSMTSNQQKSAQLIHDKAQQSIDILTQRIKSNTLTTIAQAKLHNNNDISTLLHQQVDSWKKDWNRTMHTEMWDAKTYGEGHTLQEEKDDPLVYKQPQDTCCQACKRLYTDANGKPVIFRLSELINNGTNAGKKQDGWVATLGTVHPSCMCELKYVKEDELK